jgi:hypothetical protein
MVALLMFSAADRGEHCEAAGVGAQRLSRGALSEIKDDCGSRFREFERFG